MTVFILIIGLVLGSFYLVIATRLPKEEDVLFSRSRCDSCGKELKWYNLIPVFSYIFQKGKCTYCHQKISVEHLVVELITGILFMLCYTLYGFSYNFFEGIIIISLTIIIYISDFKYMIILDSPLVVASIGTIILKFVYFDHQTAIYSILCGIGLFVTMLFIQKFGELIFKRDVLGGEI